MGNGVASSCSAGDRDLDGQVTVDEILAAVKSALDGCPRGAGCSFGFDQDMTTSPQFCVYRGTWNDACPEGEIEISWLSDGEFLVFELAVFPKVWIGAVIESPTSASIFSYWEEPDGSDTRPLTGRVQRVLSTETEQLVLTARPAPFFVDDCEFRDFRGRYTESIDF